jgi:hypothetical protein
MTKNQVDINEIIKEDYVVPESVFDRKRTKTSHFMIHSIFPNGSIAAIKQFVNAFLGDGEYPNELIRPIFVLFKIDPMDKDWRVLRPRLRGKAEYVTEYYCGKQDRCDLFMMVFQVPDKWAKEYTYFLEGKYSKFSDEYKKMFVRYTYDERSQPVESTIWRALYKSDELKKQLETYFTVNPTGANPTVFEPEDELWGIPEPKYEIYRYDRAGRD